MSLLWLSDFCRDNRYFQCYPNQSEETCFLWKQSIEPIRSKRSTTNHLLAPDICFPVLGTGYWFSRAWLSMFSRALHWQVHCYPALGTISLFPPKRLYRFEFQLKNIALISFLANFQVSLTSLVCPKSERFPVLGIWKEHSART